MTAATDCLRGLRGPTTQQQATALADMGAGLHAQLETLARDPAPWACEQMAVNLEGARRAVLRLRESLLTELPPEAA